MFRKLWLWFKNLFFGANFKATKKIYNYTLQVKEDHPLKEEVVNNIITVVGGEDYQKWAYLKCPCGCGETIQLSLMKKRRPRWHVNTKNFNGPTINPSVRQLDGCYSHFWVRNGVVKWCDDTGRPFTPQYY